MGSVVDTGSLVVVVGFQSVVVPLVPLLVSVAVLLVLVQVPAAVQVAVPQVVVEVLFCWTNVLNLSTYLSYCWDGHNLR